MTVPAHPKIYHIVHVDKLPSIVTDGVLWCDREIQQHTPQGTSIGMSKIKKRRLKELRLASHPDLFVGDCVPFYFCPRSVMLYMIHQANDPGLAFRGGQKSIIHIQSDLQKTVDWANKSGRRWAFTLSNAGARLFEDRNNLAKLHELNWTAIEATDWSQHKEGKQAEFLIEKNFPWHLVERIGVLSETAYTFAVHALQATGHRPPVEIRKDWYY